MMFIGGLVLGVLLLGSPAASYLDFGEKDYWDNYTVDTSKGTHRVEEHDNKGYWTVKYVTVR